MSGSYVLGAWWVAPLRLIKHPKSREAKMDSKGNLCSKHLDTTQFAFNNFVNFIDARWCIPKFKDSRAPAHVHLVKACWSMKLWYDPLAETQTKFALLDFNFMVMDQGGDWNVIINFVTICIPQLVTYDWICHKEFWGVISGLILHAYELEV